MNTFSAHIPEGSYSTLVIGIAVVIVVLLMMYVVRKLIGVVLGAGIIVGAFMIWQDPALLRTVQHTAGDYYSQWRSGASSPEEQQRW
ncbi:hypothetical protein G6L37_23830 [Agrobacterium rubi]|uniref:hypothetical protein n=1 Tax=Agrobacterium rubi TaxID=28099 RepID=UPI001573C446|nr:hypothetical protein [Agrobacterium rubi]NTF09165.1 hypothetical protein [Agrobacterium rubi]NTF21435.1 hypothetical protein [Agrobacterium rubi]NTF28292.1 hypothetical protein [Agrobacterium rubi]